MTWKPCSGARAPEPSETEAMHTKPLHPRSKPARFLGVTLSLAMGLSVLGILVLPAATAAAASIPVAQQPLTVRAPIPPNIVLMLDDSGSMRWDIMPDYGYLSDTSQDGLTNSAVNGVYYNPASTYAPPPHADASLYPASDFANAPINGLDASSITVDLSQYRGMYDSNKTNYRASAIQYSVALKKVAASSYAPATSCPSGWGNSSKYPGYCSYQDNNDQSDSNPSNWYYDGGIPYNFYDTSNDYYYKSRCTSVSDVYDYNGSLNNDKCYPGISFFVYTTGPQGNYTTHFVPKTAGDCNLVTLPANGVCDDSNATRQNVANWFSYYHTRILMARSGLLTAFLDLSPMYRLGFASINGSGASWISSNISDVFNFSTYTKSNNRLAEVKPFGDGTPGTRKAEFWDWAANVVQADGSTPLPGALDGAGKYYKDSQPWKSMDGDPGYDADGPNTPIACRAAYTILTTDGFWNGSVPSVGNVDGTGGPTVTGPNAQSYTFNAALPYKDDYSNTLADVAMQYWKNDLQPGITNEVPFDKNVDPAFWQHMVTFTMGMGFEPVNIAPTGTTVDQIFAWANGGAAINNFAWPKPSADNINNIADLAHAGVNGHGAFFSVKSPDAFTSALKAALNRIASRVGTGASLSANSTQLDNGTVIYQANYYSVKWKGDLSAFKVNQTTGAIDANPTWTASAMLLSSATVNGSILTYPSRDIETWNPTSGQFVSFANSGVTPPSLDSAQLTALGANAAAQVAMVDYLRGDNTLEIANGGTFRDRDTPLGDIVDSQPVYVGAPNADEFINRSFYGTSDFNAWAVGAAFTRTPLIYVAANDGMLHAYNAATGAEVYSYLPGAVITAGLKSLSDPNYGTPSAEHQFYNDGQLTVADAYLPSLPQINGSSWHTILVGTTGRGTAKAVYALDVTDPDNITPLWERSAGDGKAGSDYIGQMVGKPVIAQTNYDSTVPSSTWSVLMGNGYNSAQGVSALLQFDLATGNLDVHVTTDATSGNGLAAPVVWLGNAANGVGTVAYAGDRHGQVWSFALNDATGSNPTPTSTGSLLFTAVDGGGKVQPITAGMQAGRDPKTGNVWVFFGTGQYLTTADITTTDTQSWYGIIVQSSDASLVTKLSQGRGNLVQRAITSQTAANGNTLAARSITEWTDPSDMDGKSGWYLDLLAPGDPDPVQQGERTVDPFQFQGRLLIGATRIPQVTDVCSTGGSGWIMAIDPFSGTAPSGNFFDINGDGYVNANDLVNGKVAAGVGFDALPNAPIFVGGVMETSFDSGATSSIKTSSTSGATTRVDWRELVNP